MAFLSLQRTLKSGQSCGTDRDLMTMAKNLKKPQQSSRTVKALFQGCVMAVEALTVPFLFSALYGTEVPALTTAVACVAQAPEAFPEPASTQKNAISQSTDSEARGWAAFQDDVREKFRTELPEIGGLPLLHYAVLMDDDEWVNDLLARGADANEPTPGGDTILCTAVRIGSAKCVRALLHGGAEATQIGYEKQPPLALASLRRGADIYRALIAAGADPNTRFNAPPTKALMKRVTIRDLKNSLEDDRGVTALIACASRGDVEGASELLRSGASTSKGTRRYHRYPINFAAEQGYLFLMRILLGRQPESEPEVLVTIDLSKQRAWVIQDGVLLDTCAVSTGRAGYSTPAGRYVITDKHRTWTSTLYHCSMPFFMRLNCSAIGLHSGYVTGRPASHGCIRLPHEKAQKFFEICRIGDEVQIVH